MPKIETAPSEDRTELSVTVDGHSFKLNTLQLDTLIQQLSNAREELRPPVVNDAPLGVPVKSIVDPRYYTEPHAETGGTILMLRHPGFGWVTFLLPPEERDRLSGYFTKQAEVQKAASPSKPLH